MKRIYLAIIVAQFLLFAALAVRAQAPAATSPPSSTIASIKITGAQKFPSDQIIAASGLKSGDMVTAAQIQDATNRLAALGIFSAVNFRYTAKGNAINLEFQVQEAPTYPIVFDNFPWFTSAEIGDAIRNQVGLFTGEAPGDGTMIDEMTAVIENLLASQKIKGSVTHQLLTAAAGDGMVMQFRVDGVQLRVQSVQFGESMASGFRASEGPRLGHQRPALFPLCRRNFRERACPAALRLQRFPSSADRPSANAPDSRHERSQANRGGALDSH